MNDAQKADQWSVIRPAIARLRASIMAVASAMLCGAGLWLATVWLLLEHMLDPEKPLGPHLGLLSNYYPGYSVSWVGAFVGFFYAALTGGAVGYAVAFVYNFVALRRRGDQVAP